MQALLEALEASSVAVWDYDVPAGKVWLSAEWAQILGYGRVSGETTPAALLELVPDEDRPLAANALRRAISGERPAYRIEHRVRCRDRVAWIRSAGRVIERDADGKALRMVGTNIDITPTKNAEAALQAKEAQLDMILDEAPALIAYIDRDERVRFHNRPYRRWMGKPRTAINGMHAREVLGDEAYAQTEPYIRRALAGEPVRFERAHVAPDGSTLYLSARLVPHRNGAGEVIGYIGVLVDATERKAAQAKIEALALADALTGLPNRRALDERLAQIVPLAVRRHRSAALLYIDLDGFKAVNDRLGHAAGDELLVEVARRLRACVRESDTVARQGGDEFIVLLIDGGTGDAVAQKAAALIAELEKPVALAAGEARISASIGVALCPEHAATPPDLARKADAAMYAAKRAGKGRVALAT